MERSHYIPSLEVSESAEVWEERSKEVAELIEDCFNSSPESYAGFGGLDRCVKFVSEMTGWAQADVYTLALPRVEGIVYSPLQGTIEKA